MQTRENRIVGAKAFTLVELIIVMTLLVVAIGVAAPSLANFFRGRTVDSEARRFLALSRYAQSRAVSEGIPMTLWVDSGEGAYGLSRENDFGERDEKAVEVQVDNNITVEIEDGVRFVRDGRSMAAIYFLPDGGIGTASCSAISMQEGESAPVWIVQSRNELNYEIRDPNKDVQNTR